MKSIVLSPRQFKRLAMRIAFLFEVILFGYVYLYGSEGIRTWRAMQAHNADLVEQIAQMRIHIERHDRALHEWVKYPYYREKIAREQLQMAYKDDRIFYLT